jgi:hypothetical protein
MTPTDAPPLPVEDRLTGWASCRRAWSYLIRGDSALITIELRDGARHVSGSISPVDLVEDSGLFSGLVIRLLNEIGGLPT